MKKQWQALKLSYKPYKDALDIRIDTEIKDEVEHATVTFFWSENPTDKNFSVVLTYQDDSCKGKLKFHTYHYLLHCTFIVF